MKISLPVALIVLSGFLPKAQAQGQPPGASNTTPQFCEPANGARGLISLARVTKVTNQQVGTIDEVVVEGKNATVLGDPVGPGIIRIHFQYVKSCNQNCTPVMQRREALASKCANDALAALSLSKKFIFQETAQTSSSFKITTLNQSNQRALKSVFSRMNECERPNYP
jgi:hypothetical protein